MKAVKIFLIGATLGFCWLSGTSLFSGDHPVDPTFLHRFVPSVQEKKSDVTTATCHYRPIFGDGDSDTRAVKGVARFSEMTVDPGGRSSPVSYAAEEQAYVVLEGKGTLVYADRQLPIRQNDFMYLPPGIVHGIINSSSEPCRTIVMGFRVSPADAGSAPPNPLLANIDDVRKQTVEGHPASTLYQLLMGDTKSTRDRIAAGRVLTSLFVMEFAPGGTNVPHHHEYEEEIYLVLSGTGEMVAGGGLDGIEGKYPAKAGDAYFFRLNCTVGFYSNNSSATKARILAVRSLFPPRRTPL
jgi:mannose-6-phosphate isomerase-like protein (cupin superfamily)